MCQSEVYSISSIRFAIPQKKRTIPHTVVKTIRNEQHEQKERFKLVLLRFTKKEVNSTIGT